MKIDLDNLYECKKCGIIFNFIIAASETKHDSDFQSSWIYIGKCPVCKFDYVQFE